MILIFFKIYEVIIITEKYSFIFKTNDFHYC